jgi:hypothetical protein
MIAARATRRGVIGTLLLAGIEYTDARPWIGAAGLVVMIVLAGVLKKAL